MMWFELRGQPPLNSAVQEMARSIDTYQSYCSVVEHMLSDGVINMGRLWVLYYFTKEVAACQPSIADEIWEVYWTV